MIIFFFGIRDVLRSSSRVFLCLGATVKLASIMRIAVKKILRKHGYPPDMELKATDTVIEQAKMMASEFSK